MKYIRIKDWEKHQHYKDRNPPWIKLHTKLLMDYEFSQLSDASKLQLILLWLLASQTGNKIPADEGWIKNNIKCNGKVDLEPLETLGFVELYQDASKCVQSDIPETETEESRGEAEKEEKVSVSSNRRRKYSAEFEEFWSVYPRKQNKGKAFDAWQKMGCENEKDSIVAAITKQTEVIFKTKEMKHIPHGSSWINAERWQDEIVPETTKQVKTTDASDFI